MDALSYDAALSFIETLPSQQRIAERPLIDSIGLRLAEDVLAPYPSPRFTNSAMDGYAVCLADLMLCPELKIIGQIFAGQQPPSIKYEAGTCLKIMTGARIPEPFDGIVPVEWVQKLGADRIQVARQPQRGQFFRYEGEDYKNGSVLLAKGSELSALDVMTLSGFGLTLAKFWQPPHLLLWQTGDEVQEAGSKLDTNSVHNATAPYLEVLARKAKLAFEHQGILADDLELAYQKLARRLQQKPTPDLIVSTGAVSRGDADFIPDLLDRLGYSTIFHRVAIRPGKPILLAIHSDYGFWIGLPGNPISTLVGWHCFIRPLLRHVFNVGDWEWKTQRLLHDFSAPNDLTAFFRARQLEHGVQIAAAQGSAQFSGNSSSQLLVRCDAYQGKVLAGQEVQTLRID